MNRFPKYRTFGRDRFFYKAWHGVLLKCNLLMRKSLRKQPQPIGSSCSVARLVKEAGGIPVVATAREVFSLKGLKGVYRACSMRRAAERDNIELNYNVEEKTVSHPEGKIIKSLTIMKALEDFDAVINIAKLKTHGMTLYTGAVKNLFGVIPGTSKAEYHLRMKKLDDFADMLLDICNYIKPVLSIMDAVVGMEGQGPSAGDPRKIGAVLASPSPMLDTACVYLVGIDPGSVCTIKGRRKRIMQQNK